MWGVTMLDQLACRIQFRSLHYAGIDQAHAAMGSGQQDVICSYSQDSNGQALSLPIGRPTIGRTRQVRLEEFGRIPCEPPAPARVFFRKSVSPKG